MILAYVNLQLCLTLHSTQFCCPPYEWRHLSTARLRMATEAASVRPKPTPCPALQGPYSRVSGCLSRKRAAVNVSPSVQGAKIQGTRVMKLPRRRQQRSMGTCQECGKEILRVANVKVKQRKEGHQLRYWEQREDQKLNSAI